MRWAIWFMICILLIAAGVTYQVFLWNECKSVGHSGLYCFAMVTR